jgi:OOP family OmpA-OmpF porin
VRQYLVTLGLLISTAPLSGQPAPTAKDTTDPKVWVNYDFIPGSRVLFYTDFTEDAVGNFPKRLTFKLGNMEVAELDGQRYLRATAHSVFNVPLPEVLPPRFTIEIDVINRKTLDGPAFQLQGTLLPSRDGKTSTISWGAGGAGLTGGGGGETPYGYNEATRARYRGKPAQLRVMADGEYIKVYLDEKRFVNVPNANFARTNSLNIDLDARGEEIPLYIGRIRVAESGKSIYDELASKGRVTTQGILFDTGSDRIKPESAPTLRDIGAMLVAHPELKLSVEGHTDNVGDAAANLKLSEARAAAVKAALVKDYGADAARLTSKGLGSTKPVSPNTTAEGRQNNRRVELLKV